MAKKKKAKINQKAFEAPPTRVGEPNEVEKKYRKFIEETEGNRKPVNDPRLNLPTRTGWYE